MSEDTETEEPSKLRSLLEDQIGQNKAMATELASYKAGDVIAAKGLQYVTPEDLIDVSLDDIETKAESLEEERSKVFKSAIRRNLEAQGVTGEELENQTTAFMAAKQVPNSGASPEVGAAYQRSKSMGSGGLPAGRNPATMSTMEKLQAGLNSTS